MVFNNSSGISFRPITSGITNTWIETQEQVASTRLDEAVPLIVIDQVTAEREYNHLDQYGWMKCWMSVCLYHLDTELGVRRSFPFELIQLGLRYLEELHVHIVAEYVVEVFVWIGPDKNKETYVSLWTACKEANE